MVMRKVILTVVMFAMILSFQPNYSTAAQMGSDNAATPMGEGKE